MFHLLEDSLHSLAIDRADHVLFVADGAHWLWNRIPKLIGVLGLEPQRVHLLIDFYHATEHLGKLAALRKNWSAQQRHAWIRTQRRRLWAGHVAKVVEAVQVLCHD
ncbi:MAG TPA: ISLre2 family transposase, partial [Gammaproteobacteria bacterium]|nr:ISLre2 family transposase [Gammaproteobacteria bacterium]